jgi:hypothetical protein
MTLMLYSFTGKVKLLLKELWLCVNTAHRLPGDVSKRIPGEKGLFTEVHFSINLEVGIAAFSF